MTPLSQAARQLRRAPLFTLLATGVLALGLGAALTVVELMDTVLLRPLPFVEPQQLVNAWQSDGRGGPPLTVTGADFLAWQGETAAFERLAAVSARGFNLGGADRPERVEGALVSADFFALLGTPPLLGHALAPGAPGPRAAVLSEALWRTRFGAAADVVGRTLSLDGEPVQVVGVMPARFRYPASAELWVSARSRVPEHPTYPIDPENDRARHYLTVLGRLRPGVSLAQAQSALQVVQRRLAEQAPTESQRTLGAQLVPLREQLYGKLRPSLLGLLGVAALLLLVAWANVAHLFLTRAVARAHEVAVHVALGASRAALWGRFFAEALLVSSAAAGLGLLLGSWAAPLLVAASPQGAALPAPALSGRVVLVALALALGCAASLGLLAALQPVHAAEALKEGGKGGGGGRRQARLRSAFLVFEVALSLVLLLGAGLLVRSLHRLGAVDPGFRAEGVLAVELPLPRARYPDAATQRRAAAQLLARLQADPLVDAAGLVSRLPLSASNTVGDLTIPGREAEAFPLDLRLATEGYFEALRIPLRAGRTLTVQDAEAGAARVVILNEAAARRAFPKGDALGQRILVWGEEEPSEVVGVVGNVRHTGLDAEPRPEAWRPVGAVGWPNLTLVVRGKVPAPALLPGVRAAVAAVDGELPLVRPQAMAERVDASLSQRRFTRELLTAMALVAVLLALAGIYGVTAYAVAQRRRELGVRLALGASPERLVRLVTRETLARVVLGCGLGLVAGAALARLLQGLLYGVAPVDPLTFALLPLLLLTAAALSTAAAAARAARIDPAEALRGDAG